MTPPDRIAEIRAALAMMAFDRFGHEDTWSVDPHGEGWALMLGSGRGMHGLNMVHLTEPSYQWPTVGRYMLAAMNGAPTLLAVLDDRDREIERLRGAEEQAHCDGWDRGAADLGDAEATVRQLRAEIERLREELALAIRAVGTNGAACSTLARIDAARSIVRQLGGGASPEPSGEEAAMIHCWHDWTIAAIELDRSVAFRAGAEEMRDLCIARVHDGVGPYAAACRTGIAAMALPEPKAKR